MFDQTGLGKQQQVLAIQHIVVPPMKEIGAPVDSRVLEADNDRR